ncbi:MAG: hypothetical protein GY847_40390 [Proteobacteria bacterium]|nr:hypothetical protein [Pseudomonadota bacterium]
MSDFHWFVCLCFVAVMLAGISGEAETDLHVEWLDSSEEILKNSKDALAFTRSPLPGTNTPLDASRFCIRVTGGPVGPSIRIGLVSVDPTTDLVRDRLELRSLKPDGMGGLRTPWLVLVADMDDRSAPELAGRALRARLGDRIEARVRVGGAKGVIWAMPVGRPSWESGPLSRRRLNVHVTVLRQFPGGPPLVGGDDAGVAKVVAHQLEVINEIFAQCAIETALSEATVVADPPGPCLLSVGEQFGLPSQGGEVRIVIDGKRLGPWKVGAGYTPLETARLLSHYINKAGFLTEVSANQKLASLAFATADIVVRRLDRSLAVIKPWPDEPISTDPRQSLDIGLVNTADGIEAYDDNSAPSGTLEERTLIKALTDQDKGTLDIFVINSFSRADKQGESFIRASNSSLKDTVLVDLKALARARQSYTLSHEVGHVLLNDLGHPNTRGDDRTWLLMHSNSSSKVNGPKRLTAKDCKRIRRISNDLLR